MNNLSNFILAPSTLSLKKAGMSFERAAYKSYQGKGAAPSGQWRNTILLPPLSNITVRFRPRQFVGTSMVFSHNLLRNDFGMKLFIQTVRRGEFPDSPYSDSALCNARNWLRNCAMHCARSSNNCLSTVSILDRKCWLDQRKLRKDKYIPHAYIR